MGAERRSAVVTEKSRRMTAFHEAGHALVAHFTEGAWPLHRVTIMPRGHSLGHTLQLPDMDKDSQSFLEYRAKIDVAMGGRAAEELVYGHDHVTSGASSDIQKATNMASQMVRHFGFSDVIGPVWVPEDSAERQSTHQRALVETEIRSLIDGAQARAVALLQKHRVELERLAEALVIYETLTGEEVGKVVKGEPINRPIV